VSAPGVDIVEVGQHITTETAPPVRYVGAGPFESIESSGTPGRAAVIVGAVSGEEISRFPISAGTPMTIRREPAYAGAKEVALTFDDGPWHDSTDAVLRILNGSGIRATFFMTGSQLRNRPITARRVLAAGMEVGTHSNTHKLLAHAKHALIRAEIVRGARQMVRTLGIGPLWYRPAGGSVNSYVRHVAKAAKLRVILWTIDPRDWSRPGTSTIVRRVLAHVRPGAVILLHDGGGDRSQTVAALPQILAGLKARGYSAVTLSELYGLPEKHSTAGRWFFAVPRLAPKR
jgi:peptidoglycan/xylan/chitin deacetylase (PgdA/CDA1 family)